TDTDRRLRYSLAATFVGRMCLSGDVAALSPAQWQTALDAQHLYGRVAPIIKHGVSRLHRDLGPSRRHPRRWQAMVRTSDDGRQALIVAHAFADTPTTAAIPLPPGDWRIVETFAETDAPATTISGHTLTLSFPG